jgi:hypothetical protein
LGKGSVRYHQRESKFITGIVLDEFRRHYKPVRTPFQGNSCIVFFRSDESWHSFEHDSFLLEDRYSVNINFLYPVSRDI